MLSGFQFEHFLEIWELSVPRGGLIVVGFGKRDGSLVKKVDFSLIIFWNTGSSRFREVV